MLSENKEIFIDAKTLREIPTDELKAALQEAGESLLRIREESAPGATRQRPNYQYPHRVKGYRRLIARIKTILNERGI